MRLPIMLTIALLLAACRAPGVPSSATPRSAVAWDPRPDTRVIRYFRNESYTFSVYDQANLVPNLQIWGDGRVIWDAGSPYSNRQLRIGYFTPERLQAILGAIVDAGFFGWPARMYGSPGDHLHSSLEVRLADRAYEVDADASTTETRYPQLIDTLFAQVQGIQSQPFVPDRALFRAAPFGSEPGAATPVWPDPSDALSGAAEWAPLTGESLAFAWALIGRTPSAPVYVQAGGKRYTIAVNVPGVSLNPVNAAP